MLARSIVVLILILLTLQRAHTATHQFRFAEGEGKFENAITGVVYEAYSGFKSYANRLEYLAHEKGPIPFGAYKVTSIDGARGKFTVHLGVHNVTDTRNRDLNGFAIIGEDRRARKGNSGDKAIVVDRDCRERIARDDKIVVSKLDNVPKKKKKDL